jgi:hypothetical protein
MTGSAYGVLPQAAHGIKQLRGCVERVGIPTHLYSTLMTDLRDGRSERLQQDLATFDQDIRRWLDVQELL